MPCRAVQVACNTRAPERGRLDATWARNARASMAPTRACRRPATAPRTMARTAQARSARTGCRSIVPHRDSARRAQSRQSCAPRVGPWPKGRTAHGRQAACHQIVATHVDVAPSRVSWRRQRASDGHVGVQGHARRPRRSNTSRHSAHESAHRCAAVCPRPRRVSVPDILVPKPRSLRYVH